MLVRYGTFSRPEIFGIDGLVPATMKILSAVIVSRPTSMSLGPTNLAVSLYNVKSFSSKIIVVDFPGRYAPFAS